ncbi:MAG: uroporphyrinogen decarboxylase [Chitinophagales bacterium]
MDVKNDLLLRAARGEQVERPPVWLMRQAGRILPEYRALRERVAGFKNLVSDPDLVCEVTLQPVQALGVDAAILFSDILVIPEAMGLPYQMVESRGPWFERTIHSPADVDALHVADPETELGFVLQGVRNIRSALNNEIPLIGFAGAPWTILAYMVEGRGSKTFEKARAFLIREPEAAHKLLDMIARSTIAYLKAQVAAGVHIVQIFDSWAGILSPAQYNTFALPYLQAIREALSGTPVILFAKGAWFALEGLAETGASVLGIDWNTEIAYARAHSGGCVLQGNLDPCILFGNAETVRRETNKMLSAFGQKHIANLGHGVYPDTPLENVRVFVDTVKAFRY